MKPAQLSLPVTSRPVLHSAGPEANYALEVEIIPLNRFLDVADAQLLSANKRAGGTGRLEM